MIRRISFRGLPVAARPVATALRIGAALLVSVGALAAIPAGVAGTSHGVTFAALATTSQTAGGFTPDQIASAYDITPLQNQGIDGTGQTIALIELDRLSVSDLQAFDQAAGLPDPTVRQIYQGGRTFKLPVAGEADLDVEWAHALAPGASIQVYYIKSNQTDAMGWAAVGQAVNSAVAAGAGTISLSFGTCSADAGYTAASKAFAAAVQHGVSVFVASGDSGARPGPVKMCGNVYGVSYPASDPSVVAVGGTTLALNGDNSIQSETAWRLSGGGKAKPLLRPSWQLTASLLPGRYRYVPDVAFLANPSTGVDMVLKGRLAVAGGTSLGSPAWSAIWSLVRASGAQSGVTVGAAPAMLYRVGNSSLYSQALHDITQGTNGRYKAAVGWDPVTGWGTPDVAGLATAVQSLSTATP
ncbi:MAG TPA: S53 family peptidase [Chloroflexota bacterium]|nr:S53 family peptidase [Chloroflexota bacterium]